AIPNTVPPHSLGIANVLSSVTWSITFTVGAGIGGIVTSAFGWRVALALDAMTYLVSIAILLPLRLAPLGQAEGAPQGAVSWRDLTDAMRFVAGRRDAAIALLAKPLWGLAGALTLMLTLFGERVFPLFGSPDAGIAALYMARGIGTAIGPIAARRLYGESTRPMLRGIGLAFVVSGTGYALLSIAPNAPFAALVVLIAHLGGSTIWFFSTLILQRTVPDGMRGRVFAAELALATLAISASTWFYGAWIDGAGVSLHAATRVLAGSLFAGAAVWCALALSPIARRAESPRSPAP
ncbi:MAG: MFS transporter, partial [Acidobacteria bacterium]|nr:MFS transporter [Acidobacteriota bacterium]